MSYNPSPIVKSEPSSTNSMPPPRSRQPPTATRFPSQKPQVSAPAEVNYSDYRLVSTGTGGFKFNVLKFNTPSTIDPRTLPPPVLFNRKDPRNAGRPPPPPVDPNALSTEMGADGQFIPLVDLKPVLDIHGKPMLGKDGKVMYATGKRGPAADLSLIAPGGGAVKNKKNLFKKKTKQVHKVDQAKMRLRREERYPWVLESGVASAGPSSDGGAKVEGQEGGVEQEASEGKEVDVWVGTMEDTSNQNYVMFVFEDDKDAFQVMDVRRLYSFKQRPVYKTLDMEQAEELYARVGKGKETGRWMMHDPSRQPPPSAASSHPSASGIHASVPSSSSSRRVAVKQEAQPGWLRRTNAAAAVAGLSGGNGGGEGSRVKKEELMDWEDDGEGGGRRRGEGGEGGGDGDFDYEDEFSDDDGQLEFDPQDEAEAKELEERLKKEFRAANAVEGETVVDEDAESDDDLFGDGKAKLDANGKAIKKVLKKNDRGDTYASDDDNENPYASEPDSDSDEEPPVPPPAATIPPPPASRNSRSSQLQAQSSTNSSRSTSRPASPGAGGAALLAQRATSPHRHRNNGSTSSSRSRDREPSPSNAAAPGSNKRKGTPEAGDGGKKARLDEGAAAQRGVAAAPARRAGGGPSEAVIIAYLRQNTPDIATLIKHFKKSLKGKDAAETAENKAALIDIMKTVAVFEGGVITIRPQYA